MASFVNSKWGVFGTAAVIGASIGSFILQSIIPLKANIQQEHQKSSHSTEKDRKLHRILGKNVTQFNLTELSQIFDGIFKYIFLTLLSIQLNFIGKLFEN